MHPIAFLLMGIAAGPLRGQEVDLAVELGEAVDLPTAAQRRGRARELARTRSVHELLPAMRRFGEFDPASPGAEHLRVPLRVGKQTEETELSVYVHEAYDAARPAPLIVVFHGTGGRGHGLLGMWRSAAERWGALVLAPTEAGPNDGYRFSERERRAALAALRWMRRRYNVDEERVFATGISRGGHLTWDLAVRNPDLFCAIAPMIGSPRITLNAGQNNFRYLENVARLPIRDLQGARDDPAMVFSVRLAFEMLRGYGAADCELIEFPRLGHAFELDAVDWGAFLSGARRPRPEGVVLRCTSPEQGRAFWVDVTRTSKGIRERFSPEIPASEWNTLDESGRRRRLVEEAVDRTARLEVWMRAPGRFEASAQGVERFRLLLTPGMFDAQRTVEVAFGGKTREKRVQPDSEVLLLEFVERFDRRFLPIAELEVR